MPVHLGRRRGGEGRREGRGEGRREGGLLFFKSSVPSHRLCLRIQEQLPYTKEPRARRGRTDGRTGSPTKAGGPSPPAERGTAGPRPPRAAGEGAATPGSVQQGCAGRARCGAKCRASGAALAALPGPRPSPPRPPPLPPPGPERGRQRPCPWQSSLSEGSR